MRNADDNFSARTYAALMAEEPAHIVLKIDFKQPIEIGDFVSTFTSLDSQFERYMRTRYPDVRTHAEVFVKEIRPGSIEADLVPYVGTIVQLMEYADVIEKFVRMYGERIARYFNLGGRDQHAGKSDLRDVMGAVAAIARDPDASSTIEAVVFEDGKRKVRAAIKFDSKQARVAVDEVEKHRRELEYGSSADHERVLMVFSQSNIKDVEPGKRTGEYVVIEDIDDKALPLIYASELAEQRIKYEIREAEDNVFKKGFVVDVNVQLKGGRSVAYRLLNVHQVIDLPDD